jgi:hypothetical protein
VSRELHQAQMARELAQAAELLVLAVLREFH